MTLHKDSHSSRIVEIIGLAGTGKSTTCKKLRESCPGVLPSYRVARRRLPVAALRFLPWFVAASPQHGLRDPRGGWTGLYLSIHMDAMIRDLLFRRRKQVGKLFLDQGPIFNCISAERLANQGEIHKSASERMRKLLIENLKFLDDIVVLNADLPILLQRIDGRGQDHQIKGSDTGSAQAFLEDYRKRYESILEDIQERADIRIMRIDTGHQDPDQVVSEICETFQLATHEHVSPADVASTR